MLKLTPTLRISLATPKMLDFFFLPVAVAAGAPAATCAYSPPLGAAFVVPPIFLRLNFSNRAPRELSPLDARLPEEAPAMLSSLLTARWIVWVLAVGGMDSMGDRGGISSLCDDALGLMRGLFPDGGIFGLGAAPELPLFLGLSFFLRLSPLPPTVSGLERSAALGKLEEGLEAMRCLALSLLLNAAGLSKRTAPGLPLLSLAGDLAAMNEAIVVGVDS